MIVKALDVIETSHSQMQIEMQEIKVAILDLYNNEPNEGMRGIQSILNTHVMKPNQVLTWDRFDVRFKDQVPDLSYDIYISSGGPGSPLEDVNAQWEKDYFKLIDAIFHHNKTTTGNKKYIFFICHSFQLICRHLKLADVIKRKSTAFGIFPIHKLTEGFEDVCMENLPDPFFGVDSRDWQVIQPDHDELKKQGVQLLAIEKYRPHVPYERAIMAIRFNNEMVGTQFHPEADPVGMLHYLMREDKRAHIIEHHGVEKYEEMVLHLNDPDKILLTQRTMIPAFLDDAITLLSTVEV